MTSHTSQTYQTVVSAFVLEEQTGLTLDDLCRACKAEAALIVELVHEGVLEDVQPSGTSAPDEWRFTGLHMHRATVALRLQRDLGVNLAGAALALDLMGEMQTLRAQLHRLQTTG